MADDEPGSNDKPKGDHGGKRKNAGRPPLTEEEKQVRDVAKKAAKEAAKAVRDAARDATRKGMMADVEGLANAVSQRQAAADELKDKVLTPVITPETAQAIIAASKAMALREHKERGSPFQIAIHPPAATPPKELQMAMDENLSWAEGQWASNVVTAIGAEGLLFPGFPYLAALAQRPEYRVMSETIATEMTRKWIKFKGKGSSEEAKKKSDRIKQLDDLFNELEVRDRFKDLATEDGLFGRSHVYLDLGVDLDGAGDDELKKPIGQGTNKMSLGKIAKGALKRLQPVEAVWVYPTYYNATNPLKGDWYKPQHWYVMGKEVHHSRLLTFVGRQVPDLLKPAYSFGGLSLSQLAKPYVDIWLQTRASVGALIHSFSVMVLSTDMQTVLSGGGAGSLMNRIAIFNALRDNQNTFAINKNTEDFKNVSAPLSGLEALQAQSQEHMMSVPRIPAVKFTGIQPTGLNASSEGEIRAFYDTIGAYQNSLFRPNLTRIMHFAMLSLWGEIDEEIIFDFEPLWEMSEKERAELRKANAEAGQIHIDAGVLHPEEERRRIADDPDTLYPGMEVEDVPDLREEEEAGLEPEGGRPQPVAETGPELGPHPDPKGGKGGGEARDDDVPPRGLAWADRYEWMRGYDIPAVDAGGNQIMPTARGEAARKGLRIGSRVRYTISRGPSGTGRAVGFVQTPEGEDRVAILDIEQDRFICAPAADVSTRPVTGEERGGAGDADRPFDLGVDDGTFNESDHPRAPDGKFGSGGRSSPTQKLTPTEKTWLSTYSGDDFLRLNRELRAGGDGGEATRKLDSAISKSTVPAGTTLYRGVSKAALKSLVGGDEIKTGQVLSDKAFLSASTDSWIGNEIGGVQLSIEVGDGQHGLDMAGLGNNEHEKEVLLPRNTRLEVVGIRAPKSVGQPIRVRVKTLPPG